MQIRVKPGLEPGLEALGLGPEDLLALSTFTDFDKAKEALDQLKERARKGYKRAALALHPDITGGDQAKTDKLILAKRVFDALVSITVEKAAPPPLPPVVLYHTYQVVSQSAATGTANTTTARVVTFVRNY